jgi:hypothetical protein
MSNLIEKANNLYSILGQFKGIVSRDFGTLFLFHWIDLKVVIGPDQFYF